MVNHCLNSSLSEVSNDSNNIIRDGNKMAWLSKLAHGQGLIFITVGAAAAIILVLFLLSAFSIASKDYAIDVDPIKDSQNLFNTARVTITNTGKLPLTNIVVDYGGSGRQDIEKLTSLSPGDKVILSPPDDSPLKSVTVKTDQGLTLTKNYRSPFKIPGMMGS